MSSPPVLTVEQVRAQLARAREQLPALPPELRPSAAAALVALEEASEDVALVGTLAVARAWSWWSAVNPFRDPPSSPIGRAEALAALAGAGDALQALEDGRREAWDRLRRVALEVGLAAVKAALPLLLAAL